MKRRYFIGGLSAYFANYYDYNSNAAIRANSGTTTANYTVWGSVEPE